MRRTGIELIQRLTDRLSIREGELYGLRCRLAATPMNCHCTRANLRGLIHSRRNRVRKLRNQLMRAKRTGRR